MGVFIDRRTRQGKKLHNLLSQFKLIIEDIFDETGKPCHMQLIVPKGQFYDLRKCCADKEGVRYLLYDLDFGTIKIILVEV